MNQIPVIVFTPLDADNRNFNSIIHSAMEYLSLKYMLFPTSIVAGDKSTSLIDSDQFRKYIDIIKNVLIGKIGGVIYHTDLFIDDKAIYEELRGFLISRRDILSVTALEYYIHPNKPIHKLLKEELYDYLVENAMSSNILVVDPKYIEEVSGTEIIHVDMFSSLLRETAKELSITHYAFSYYISSHDIYLVGVDLRSNVSHREKMITPTLLSIPDVIVTYSSLINKTARFLGLTYFIGSIIASTIRNVYKPPRLEDFMGSILSPIESSLQYWVRTKIGEVTVIYPKPLEGLRVSAYKYEVLKMLKQALEIVTSNSDVFSKYIQVTGSNILQSIPAEYVRSFHDIASPHRLVKGPRGEIIVVGEPDFGQSRFLSRILYTLMRVNRRITALMSLSYSESLLEIAKRMGIPVIKIEFKIPKGKKVWTIRLEDLVENAIVDKLPKIKDKEPPIILYHEGAIGIEPAIYFADTNALKLLNRLIEIDRIMRSI